MNADDPRIDWNNPDTVREDGSRVFSVRCRIPFTAPMEGGARKLETVERSTDAIALDERVIDDSGEGIILQPDATGDPQNDDEIEFTRPTLVAGIASSTSVDSFGTEMSLRALKLMAMQFLREPGVPYLPRHNHGLKSVEWDEVIGRSVHAEVVPVEEVRKAYNGGEAQFLLRVSISLYNDEPAAQALIRRLERGEPIGQSIGGWFTSLQVVQNEEGDVERVIVQGVELDHLALTRAPANPDSLGLVALRDNLQASAHDHRVSALVERLRDGQTVCVAPTVASALREVAEERHVIKVVDNGDGTVSMVFEVSDHADSPEDEESALTTQQIDERTQEAVSPVEPVAQVSDEVPETPGPDSHSLDNTERTTHPAEEQSDVRRSALPKNVVLPELPTGNHPVEEHAMTEQDLQAIRDAFGAQVTPLVERLDALEARTKTPEQDPDPIPAPVPDPVDARVVAAERSAADALARAERAEDAAARMARNGGGRQGRTMVPSIAAGPAATSGYSGLVAQARSMAPTLAAVAERCIPIATEQDGANKVSRGQLEVALRDLLVSAENDGIITDPNHRAAWQ